MSGWVLHHKLETTPGIFLTAYQQHLSQVKEILDKCVLAAYSSSQREKKEPQLIAQATKCQE